MTNTLYTIPTLTRVPERGKIPPKIDPSLGLKRLNRQLPRPLPPGTWPKASDEADGNTARPQPVFEVQLSQTLRPILKRFAGRLARYANIDILKTSSAEEENILGNVALSPPAEEEDILATIKPCH